MNESHERARAGGEAAELRIALCLDPRDMAAEREHLKARVVPELRRYARERGLELTWIDPHAEGGNRPRSAVAELELRLQALREPGTIVLSFLGDLRPADPADGRWDDAPGPIPSELAAPLAAVRAGEAVIAAELLHGALEQEGDRTVLVYPRRPQEGGTKPPGLDALMGRLGVAGAIVRPPYETPEQLAAAVVNDLAGLIKDRATADPQEDSGSQRRRGQRASWSGSRDLSIPSETREQLDSFLKKPNEPSFVLTGPPGLISAAIAEAIAGATGSGYTFARVVEVEPGSGELSPILPLLDLLAEMREVQGGDDDLPSTPERLTQSLVPTAAQIAGPALVAIVGLERLDGEAAALEWLPRIWPSHLRLILGCAEEGAALEAFRNEGWPIVAIPGADEASPWPETLARLERSLGADAAVPLLGPIATARRGVTETEWLRASGCPWPDLARFRALAGNLLEERGPLWTFRSPEVQAEVVRWLGEERADAARRNLADALQADPDPDRAVDEIPWLLWHSCEWASLGACLGDVPMALAFVERERQAEWVGYWLALGGRESPRQRVQEGLDRLEAQSPDAIQLLHALHELGHLLHLVGEYNAAEGTLRRVLAIREMTQGPNHPTVAQALNNLAGLLTERQSFEEAEELYNRALKIAETTLGPDHPRAVQTLNNLALLKLETGGDAEAASLLQQVLQFREATSGPDHPLTAQTLQRLGGALLALGIYDEAELALERAIQIREGVFGTDHSLTASPLHDLAAAIDAQGRPEEAARHYERALVIREKTLGAHHPFVAETLNELALVVHTQGKEADAEPLYRRALEIDERNHGPDHPQTAIGLNNLGLLQAARDAHEEAESLFRRAYEIADHSLGPDHPQTTTSLDNLAELIDIRGDRPRAAELMRSVAARREQHLGPNHPLTEQARLDAERFSVPVAEGPQTEEPQEAQEPRATEEVPEIVAEERLVAEEAAIVAAEERETAIPEVSVAPPETTEPAVAPPAETINDEPIPADTAAEEAPGDLIPPHEDEEFVRDREEKEAAATAEQGEGPAILPEIEPEPPTVILPNLAPPDTFASEPVAADNDAATRLEEAEPSPPQSVEPEEDLAPTVVWGEDDGVPMLPAPMTNGADPSLPVMALAPSANGTDDSHFVPVSLPEAAVAGAEQSVAAEPGPAPEPHMPEAPPEPPAPPPISEPTSFAPPEDDAEDEPASLPTLPESAESEHATSPEVPASLGGQEGMPPAPKPPVHEPIPEDPEVWDALDDGEREKLVALQRAHGPDHARVARFRHRLARDQRRKGRWSVADRLYRQALKLRERAAEPNPRRIANTLAGLAIVQKKLGGCKEALDPALRALESRRKDFGTDHPQAVASQLQVVRLLRDIDPRQVEPLAREAREILQRTRGERDPRVAVAALRHGEILERLGDPGEAEPAYRQAVAILEDVRGPNSPQAIAARRRLVSHLLRHRKDADAVPLLQRQIEAIGERSGVNHPAVTNPTHALGRILAVQGRPEEAIPLLRGALAAREAALGTNHPKVLATLSRLTQAVRPGGDPAAIEPLVARLAAAKEARLGPGHPSIAPLHDELSALAESRGDRRAAIDATIRALSARETGLGPEHEASVASLHRLIGLLFAERDMAALEPLLRRDVELSTRRHGPGHPHTAASHKNLAGLLYGKGDLKGSKGAYQRALTIEESALGHDHPTTAATREALEAIAEAIGSKKGGFWPFGKRK